MRINSEIFDALKRAVRDSGSQLEFARKTGLPQSYISRYLSGQIREIRSDSWDKLQPYLRPYLRKEVHEETGAELSLSNVEKELLSIYHALDAHTRDALLQHAREQLTSQLQQQWESSKR